MGCFYVMFQHTKYIEVILNGTEIKIDAKFEEKLNCSSKNDMGYLVNSHQSIWDFDRIL